jgi:hypothetical protein
MGMNKRPLLAILAALLLCQPVVGDEREPSPRSRKFLAPPAPIEPDYSATPSYALLYFGERTPKVVWVIVAGDAVYVDCNSNRDLTETGEKFVFSTPRPSGGNYVEERKVREITITHGKLKHTGLSIRQFRVRDEVLFEIKSDTDKQLKDQVAKSKDRFVYYLSVNVQVTELPRGKIAFTGRISQSAGHDADGSLQFARWPGEHPIVHFGGPFEMALLTAQTLTAGDKPSELQTMIGTPGRGPGTFASVGFGGVFSDEVHPVAEIEFPAKSSGAEPLRGRFVLKHRC